jgi:solute carrier family 25 protein 44
MAVCVDAIGFPFELIKTRLQVQTARFSAGSLAFQPYDSLRGAIRDIYAKEGVRGFWKGWSASATGVVPSELVYFGVLEQTKSAVRRSLGLIGSRSRSQLSVHQIDRREAFASFIAGGVADIASATVWAPADLISQRLQVQGPIAARHVYQGPVSVGRSIIHSHGIRGLFAGVGPAIATHAPTSAVIWSTFTEARRVLDRHAPTQWCVDHPVALDALAASVGGVVGAAVLNPLDVVRTRLQTQGMFVTRGHEAHLSSFLNAFGAIWRTEGLHGFTRGASVRMCAFAPTTAIVLTLYESIKVACTKEGYETPDEL